MSKPYLSRPPAHFLLILLSVLLAGCTAAPAGAPVPAAAAPTVVPPSPAPAASTAPATQYPLTLTDSAGRQVTFKQAPMRIVSVSPGFTEVLFAVGAGASVVGVDDFSDFPDAARSLPKVGYSRLDLERIVGLNPDLVLLATRQRTFLAEIEKLGLPVLLFTEPDTVAGVFDNIRLVGRLTNHLAEAERLAAEQEARLRALAERLATVQQGPRFFHELTPDLFTVGPKSFIGNMYQIVKAENIVRDPAQPFPKLSLETLIAEDPEVIFLADGGDLGGQTPELVKARPGWSNISAVKNNRIYVIDGNVLSRPGPRVVDGIEQLARLLYPDRFR